MNRSFPLSATLLCLLLSTSCTEEKVIYKTREVQVEQQQEEKVNEAMNAKFFNAVRFGRHQKAIELMETGKVDVNVKSSVKDDPYFGKIVSALYLALKQGHHSLAAELIQRFDADVFTKEITSILEDLPSEIKEVIQNKQSSIEHSAGRAINDGDFKTLKELSKKYSRPFNNRNLDRAIQYFPKEDLDNYYQAIKILNQNNMETYELIPEFAASVYENGGENQHYSDAHIFQKVKKNIWLREKETDLFTIEEFKRFAKYFPKVGDRVIPLMLLNDLRDLASLHRRGKTQEAANTFESFKNRVDFLLLNKLASLQDSSDINSDPIRGLIFFISEIESDNKDLIASSVDDPAFLDYAKKVLDLLVKSHNLDLNRPFISEVVVNGGLEPVRKNVEKRALQQDNLYLSPLTIKLFAEYGYDFNFSVSYQERWFWYPDQSVLTKFVQDQFNNKFEDNYMAPSTEDVLAIASEMLAHMDQDQLEKSLIAENAVMTLNSLLRTFGFDREITDNVEFLKFTTQLLSLLKDKGVKFDRNVPNSLFGGVDIAGEKSLLEQINIPSDFKDLTVTQELLELFQ